MSSFRGRGPYEEVSSITEDGIRISGWFLPGKRKKGTALIVHGFNMNKGHMLERAALFLEMDMSVLLIDLRARGESGGARTSLGNDSSLDILALSDIYNESFRKYGLLTLYGFSHGGRAVIYTAGLMNNRTPVILESPPYSLTNSFKRTYRIAQVPNMDDASLDMALSAMASNPLLLLIGDEDTAIIEEEANTIIGFTKNEYSMMKVFSNTGHDVFTMENQTEIKRLIAVFLDMR